MKCRTYFWNNLEYLSISLSSHGPLVHSKFANATLPHAKGCRIAPVRTKEVVGKEKILIESLLIVTIC